MISITLENLVIILAISFILGLMAYKAKIVDFDGMASGIIVSTGILIYTDIKFFIIFFSFVILGAIFTVYKWKKKVEEKTAEKESGRGLSNVMGNGLPPLIFAMIYALLPEQNLFLLCAYICSVAALAADTSSSEIGVLSKEKPIMITTLRKVEKGTDGAISILGTLAGFITTVIIGFIAVIIGIANIYLFLVIVIAGNFGNFIDSIVGATLEQRKIFGKQETNFVCGISGGLFGLLLMLI